MKRSTAPTAAGQVRITAGQWRGRKLAVVDVPGLRPTGDRVRETLFNWLQNRIAGSRCLDLYAGSGALGFESLSRFAASVTFVEPDRQAFQTLQQSATALGVQAVGCASFHQSTAERFLAEHQQPFDIVFIDPPFDEGVQWHSVAALLPAHLARDALVYVEAPSNQAVPDAFPHDLCVYREKQFGDVRALLLRRSAL